jgi:hypothetical protein
MVSIFSCITIGSHRQAHPRHSDHACLLANYRHRRAYSFPDKPPHPPVQSCRVAAEDQHRYADWNASNNGDALQYADTTRVIERLTQARLSRFHSTGAAGIQQNSSNLDILLHPRRV